MPGRVHVGATPLGGDNEPLLTRGILRREQNYLSERDLKSGDLVDRNEQPLFDFDRADKEKRRIPATSVVNVVCTLPGCGRMTAAIFIWLLNLVCFLVHLAFFIVTLVFLFGWDGTERKLWAPVYRIRANWTEPGVDGYAFDLVENQQGLNIGVITAVWFGITAGFHFLALIAGVFERYWMIYWRQMDDAFCWWCVAEPQVRPRARSPTLPARAAGGGSSTPSPPRSWCSAPPSVSDSERRAS